MIYISQCYIKLNRDKSFKDLLNWKKEQMILFEKEMNIKIIDKKSEEKFRKWLDKRSK